MQQMIIIKRNYCLHNICRLNTLYTGANWVAIVEQCNVEVTLANSFCPSAPPTPLPTWKFNL